MELVPLHEHPEFKERCSSLLNSEWPTSPEFREKFLNESCDDFPINLVLISGDTLVGHVRVRKLEFLPTDCFINSVIIVPEMRGQGFGKLLLQKLEEFVKSHDVKTIYLTTNGQEEFYKKAGYAVCNPTHTVFDPSIPTYMKKILL